MQVDASFMSLPVAVNRIYAKEGVLGFYSGLGSSLFGICLSNGVYYYWYELLGGGSKRAGVFEGLAIGAMAGSFEIYG